MEEKVKESDLKIKALKDTIAQAKRDAQKEVHAVATSPLKKGKAVCPEELTWVAPILAANQRIGDRVAFAHELKQGMSQYKPSPLVQQFIQDTGEAELALLLPKLSV